MSKVFRTIMRLIIAAACSLAFLNFSPVLAPGIIANIDISVTRIFVAILYYKLQWKVIKAEPYSTIIGYPVISYLSLNRMVLYVQEVLAHRKYNVKWVKTSLKYSRDLITSFQNPIKLYILRLSTFWFFFELGLFFPNSI